MKQYISDLIELECVLSQNDSDNFLQSFKKILKSSPNQKETLTQNPGYTIYIPPETQNIDSQKNILLVIHELSRTGAPIVVVDTAKTLIKNGYFVTIVTMRRGPLVKELLDHGIPVISDRELALVHETKNLLDSKENHFHIDTLFNAFSQTIVVTAIYYNLVHRYSYGKKPIIWWLHEGTATYDYYSSFMPQQLGPAARVYTGGQYAHDQLQKYGLEYHASILNYGVKDAKQTKNAKNQPASTIKFILPGSIGPRKGQTILLDAIRNLPEKYKKISEFIFIGDVTSESDLEGQKIKKELIRFSQTLPNVTYLTSVSRAKLFTLYQSVDVLVLPSLDDPMPVVATEMLMYSKVVLCSDATGTSYYLKDGHNGFVFKSGDSTQLRDKIIYIIDHKNNLTKIGKKGREVYEQNFKMNIFEKNLLHIIKEAK